MKKVALLVLLLLTLGIVGTFAYQKYYQQYTNPLLVVLLMVKDEEAVMQGTLQPFLDAGIDSYLILDTGSTDKTIDVTKKLFEKHAVKYGYIVEQPFVDFATSRNYAIEQAEKLFPHAAFFLMIDAEWYMHNVQGLLEFCKKNILSKALSYLIAMHKDDDPAMTYYQQRLFKSHNDIRFEGVVYEMLNKRYHVKLSEDIYFVWRPTRQGEDKSKARWVRDKKLLLAYQEKKPNDPRTLFYLGQTCNDLQDLEGACYWYKKRCKISAWKEEDFMAHYRLAILYERLGDWDQAENYYVKAYKVYPSRAEPLVRVARYYLENKDYVQAFKYAVNAATVSYPERDILCVEKELYDFWRYYILAKSAQHLGEHKVGKLAVEHALQHYPDHEELQQLLNYY